MTTAPQSSAAEQLWDGIAKYRRACKLNGQEQGGYPGILNVSVDDIEGESLLLALEPLCVATGSACNSLSQGTVLCFAGAWP